MGDPGQTDSTEALAALYAAERADVQNVLGHSLNLISILVGYSAIIGATWSQAPNAIPQWMTVFLPVPVLAAIAWHSQMNSLVFVHNQSISVLEEKLFKHTPTIGAKNRLWVGANCGRLVTDLPLLLAEKRIGMAAASLIAYGTVAGVVLAITTASIVIPIEQGHYIGLAQTMAVVYLIVVCLLIISYAATFTIDRKKLDQWAVSAKDNGLL